MANSLLLQKTCKVIIKHDYTKNVNKVNKFLANNYVMVGIPEDENEREFDNEITNAELLFIQTNGSPANNIPPRPLIEPALENEKKVISEMLLSCAFDAFSNKQSAYKKLEKLGIYAVNKVKRWFYNEENGWPPNAESTARAKRRKGSTKIWPLIDTGELRNSITYVLVKDGKMK